MNFTFQRLFFIPVLLMLMSLMSEERDKNLVYWDQRSLTWDDFKGRAPSSSPYVALTNSAVQLNFGGEGKEVWFEVEAIFYPKLSWKKKNVDDHILKHEQGHFDITEIHTRILRQKIKELQFKKYDRISPDVQKLFNQVTKDCSDMQDLYDKETDHSKKKEEQYRWNEKITTMLDSLSGHTERSIRLDVAYLF